MAEPSSDTTPSSGPPDRHAPNISPPSQNSGSGPGTAYTLGHHEQLQVHSGGLSGDSSRSSAIPHSAHYTSYPSSVAHSPSAPDGSLHYRTPPPQPNTYYPNPTSAPMSQYPNYFGAPSYGQQHLSLPHMPHPTSLHDSTHRTTHQFTPGPFQSPRSAIPATDQSSLHSSVTQAGHTPFPYQPMAPPLNSSPSPLSTPQDTPSGTFAIPSHSSPALSIQHPGTVAPLPSNITTADSLVHSVRSHEEVLAKVLADQTHLRSRLDAQDAELQDLRRAVAEKGTQKGKGRGRAKGDVKPGGKDTKSNDYPAAKVS